MHVLSASILELDFNGLVKGEKIFANIILELPVAVWAAHQTIRGERRNMEKTNTASQHFPSLGKMPSAASFPKPVDLLNSLVVPLARHRVPLWRSCLNSCKAILAVSCIYFNCSYLLGSVPIFWNPSPVKHCHFLRRSNKPTFFKVHIWLQPCYLKDRSYA